MPLTAPELDDRHFQDIVDEAKKRIPHYTNEWTDHNVSDPGVTFIELFAWMTDMLLYRLNQVPDRHFIKFMDMVGIELRPRVAAKVPVTFWLSAPQPNPVRVPGGTEVSSTQTETEAPVIFTTDQEFVVTPPQLRSVLSEVATQRVGEKRLEKHSLPLLGRGAARVGAFSQVPQVDDALYFGFDNDLSNHILSLEVDCETAGGAGVVPTMPPYVWEAASNDPNNRWAQCDVELDTSLGLNVSGRIELHLPQMAKFRIEENNLYWLRVRVRPIGRAERDAGMLPYEVSPIVRRVGAVSMGGTTRATHAQVITHELLGRSTGEPGQRFFAKRTPMLKCFPDEQILIEMGEQMELWQEVEDFSNSTGEDQHYMVDYLSGEVRFGPAIRQRDGDIKRFGAIPPRRANIFYARYRTGGGLDGNVEAGIINTLKTAIPYIDRIINRVPARGGLDAESLEEAMMRVPHMMRSRDRAVTAADFEFLTRQALPATISRVRCLQPRPSDAAPSVIPGQVYVLVVPKVRYPAGYLSPDELTVSEDELNLLRAYLDERRLLTTRLYVRTPAYRWVSVRVLAGAAPGVDQGEVENAIQRRLYHFLNPLTGGFDENGWPFGRDLFVADVYQALQNMPNVLFIRQVEMYIAMPGGQRMGQPVEMVDVVGHGVVVSGVHEVEIVNG